MMNGEAYFQSLRTMKTVVMKLQSTMMRHTGGCFGGHAESFRRRGGTAGHSEAPFSSHGGCQARSEGSRKACRNISKGQRYPGKELRT